MATIFKIVGPGTGAFEITESGGSVTATVAGSALATAASVAAVQPGMGYTSVSATTTYVTADADKLVVLGGSGTYTVNISTAVAGDRWRFIANNTTGTITITVIGGSGTITGPIASVSNTTGGVVISDATAVVYTGGSGTVGDWAELVALSTNTFAVTGAEGADGAWTAAAP